MRYVQIYKKVPLKVRIAHYKADGQYLSLTPDEAIVLSKKLMTYARKAKQAELDRLLKGEYP